MSSSCYEALSTFYLAVSVLEWTHMPLRTDTRQTITAVRQTQHLKAILLALHHQVNVKNDTDILVLATMHLWPDVSGLARKMLCDVVSSAMFVSSRPSMPRKASEYFAMAFSPAMSDHCQPH